MNTDLTAHPFAAARPRLTNLFYHRCRVATFKICFAAFIAILGIENSKLRASAYKLYRWLAFRTDRYPNVWAKSLDIQKATGLCERTVIAARKELKRLSLVRAHRLGGPGGGYHIEVLNPKTHLPLDWDSKPRPRFICLPCASMLSMIYPHKWTGNDALVYDALCNLMCQQGQSELMRDKKHWFKALSKNALLTVEARLQQTGFIRVKDDLIEILHPETSKSMPAKCWDEEPADRAYYIEEQTGHRKLFSEEEMTPQVIITYFMKSLPRQEDWVPGSNAHCPFHDDENPSLSINTDTGQWYCHTCDLGGHKLVTFEMELSGLSDVHEAWTRVAKKTGFKLCPRSRGKVTHTHEYWDEHGPSYMVRRYEDGTASYRRYTTYPQTAPRLGNRKRLLYNLPEVIAANVVIICEGEKKCDVLSALKLVDPDGKPVAITTTGGANSWRVEFVEYLVGKLVLVFIDSDEPGERYCDAIEASLARAGVEHQIVGFEEFGNDVRDYLKDHTAAELVGYVDSEWLYVPRLSDVSALSDYKIEV